MTKRCPKCNINKDISEFGKDKYNKDGLTSRCKKCTNKKSTDWKRNNSKKYAISIRKTHLKRDYGITLEQYDEMFEQQNGVCAICGKLETAKDRYGGITRLSIDHNHKTGKIRALLCRNCNHLLGCVEENVTVLQSAISYLHDHSG